MASMECEEFRIDPEWLSQHGYERNGAVRGTKRIVSRVPLPRPVSRRPLITFGVGALCEMTADELASLPAPLRFLDEQLLKCDEEAMGISRADPIECAIVSAPKSTPPSVVPIEVLCGVHGRYPLVVRRKGAKKEPWLLVCSLAGCNCHAEAFFSRGRRSNGRVRATALKARRSAKVIAKVPKEKRVAAPFSSVPMQKEKQQPPILSGASADGTFHTGTLRCKCAHHRDSTMEDPGRQSYIHLNVACFWDCCGGMWSTDTCKVPPTPLVEPSAEKPRQKPQQPPETHAAAATATAGKVPVDPACGIAGVEVYVDETGAAWDCMLNQTNIGSNNNKFYIAQLLSNAASSAYSLWTRWGRVGERGQSSTVSFGKDLGQAKAAFRKKYKEKTVNEWDDRANFVPHAGKYTLIVMETNTHGNGSAATESVPSALPEPVQAVVRLVFDMKMMERTMTKLEFDVKKQPLGSLSHFQIRSGHVILGKVEAEISSGRASAEKLAELSSRFYTLIPHDFGRSRPPVIRDMATVRSKVEMLEALDQAVTAAAMMKESEGVDALYKRLYTKLEPVANDGWEWNLVKEFVEASFRGQQQAKAPTIRALFNVDRVGEKEKFAGTEPIGNTWLLWHGSRLSNFAGILSQGLRIAPPEAPKTGYRFGKGIYFADMARVSTGYCHAEPGTEFLMLLAEVRLGTVAPLAYDQYMEQPLPGTDSSKALGRIEPDPQSPINVALDGDDGSKVTVPAGPIVEAQRSDVSCTENEYVVYNPAQVRQRYLVHFVCN